MKIEGNLRIVDWAAIGLLIGIAFGPVWRLIEPDLALWFWPSFGALIHRWPAPRQTGAGMEKSQA